LSSGVTRTSPIVKRTNRRGLPRQMDRGLFWRMGHQQFRAHLAGLVAPIVAQISAALEPAVQVPSRAARVVHARLLETPSLVGGSLAVRLFPSLSTCQCFFSNAGSTAWHSSMLRPWQARVGRHAEQLVRQFADTRLQLRVRPPSWCLASLPCSKPAAPPLPRRAAPGPRLASVRESPVLSLDRGAVPSYGGRVRH
jgi:hypothetical protein